MYCAVEDGTYSGRPYRIQVLPTRASRFFPLSYHAGQAWAPFIDDEQLDVVQLHTFPFFAMLGHYLSFGPKKPKEGAETPKGDGRG